MKLSLLTSWGLLSALVLGALATPINAADLYVATTGSDTTGTGTVASPYRTMQKALNLASAGDNVLVRGGVYRETISLVGKSGRDNSPITLTSYPGETATLSGLDVATLSWTRTTLRGVTAPVYVAPYNGPVFDQMFFNGRPLLEARWPNVPLNANGDWDFFARSVWAAVDTTGNQYGTLACANLATLTGPTGWNRSLAGVRAVLNVAHQYFTWTRRVTSHAAGTGTLTYPTNLGSSISAADETGTTLAFNDDRFYLVGEKEFLDAPGEWYFDSANGLLYLCPPGGVDPGAALVELKTRNIALSADQNSGFLTIDRMRFFGTAFALGKSATARSNRIIFRNNTVLYPCWTEWFAMPSGDPRESDEQAFPTIHANNSIVANNTFAYGMTSALLINGWDNLVENNAIHDFDYSSSLNTPPLQISRNWAYYVGLGGRATVRFNSLWNSGGILLQVGQGDNDVYQNDLSGAFRACWGGNKDVSAFYTQSTYCQGTRVHHNWVHDGRVGDPQPWGGGIAIRGDDDTTGLTIDHNVMWNLGGAGVELKNPLAPTPTQGNICAYNTVFSHGQNLAIKTALIVLAPPTGSGGKTNLYTSVVGNLAETIFGGWTRNPLGPLASLTANTTGLTTESQLENLGWFDFRPSTRAVAALDRGVMLANISGVTVGPPDIGAYERGDRTYFIPGVRSNRVSFPIVPDAATDVPASRDVLMWRPAYNAAGHQLYLGTSRTAVLIAGPSSPEFRANFTGEANVYALPALVPGQSYFWRVDAVAADGSVTPGDVWSFTTARSATDPMPQSVTSRLVNLSILTELSPGGDSFTMGFVVSGAGTNGTKPLVLRAVGPSLAAFGLRGVLDDPKFELFQGSKKVNENDNWGGGSKLSDAMTAVGAFAYASPTSLDAALAVSVPAGDSSVRVSSVGGGGGTVLAEVYDATPSGAFSVSTPRLLNVSVLKQLGTGLTAGFVVGGTGTKYVLIRAVGPTLGTAFGIPGTVIDPQLTLNGSKGVIATNDNWGGSGTLTAAFSSVGAFSLPGTSRDAALIAALTPGNYTVQVSGVGGATGLMLLEVYELP